jgi:hypothetical protein
MLLSNSSFTKFATVMPLCEIQNVFVPNINAAILKGKCGEFSEKGINFL